MGLWLFHSIEKTRVTLVKWSNGIQTPNSLIFFLKIVGHVYPVSMEKPRDTRLVSRVFAAPRSQSWAKTRHLTSDTIQEVQWLMISAIWTHLFTWWRFVYKSMNWCQSYLERNVFKRKKHTKQNKSCLQHKACPRIKTESPNAYYDTLMHMFECSQKIFW